MISANRQQCQLRTQAFSDLFESVEIRCVAGVVDGVLAGTKNVSAIATVNVAHDARSPMTRWRVGDFDISELETLPPFEFDYARKSQITHQVAQMPGHDDQRPLAGLSLGQPGDGSQRRPVQVIEVGVRHQHRIDRRQVAHSHSRTTQPLQHEDPAGEVRVDQDVLAADLQKEAGVSDECHSQLSTPGENRLTGDAAAGGQGGASYERAKLAGLTSDCDSYHEYLIIRRC